MHATRSEEQRARRIPTRDRQICVRFLHVPLRPDNFGPIATLFPFLSGSSRLESRLRPRLAAYSWATPIFVFTPELEATEHPATVARIAGCCPGRVEREWKRAGIPLLRIIGRRRRNASWGLSSSGTPGLETNSQMPSLPDSTIGLSTEPGKPSRMIDKKRGAPNA